MDEKNIKIQCHSPLSELMEKFIHEKQAYGYRYIRKVMSFFDWTVFYAKLVCNLLNYHGMSSINGHQNGFMKNRATRD